MLQHETLTSTTDQLIQSSNIQENASLDPLKAKGEIIQELVVELNDANKNELRRYLLLTSDKMNDIIQNLESGSNSQEESFAKDCTSQIRQAVFKPGLEMEDIVNQNIVLEKICQQQDLFLREVYTESENMASQTLKLKKESQEIKQQTLLIEKNTNDLEKNFKNESNALREETEEFKEQINLLEIDIATEKEKEMQQKQQNEESRLKLNKLLELQNKLEWQLKDEESQHLKVLQENQIIEKQIRDRSNFQARLMIDFQKSLSEKKMLNDELQRIKGNVRVYCRVRPLSKSEIADPKISNVLSVSSSNNITLTIPDEMLKSDNNQKVFRFHFEQIFDSNSSQENVFAELSQLIQSLIDGFNVCIFAYGQTGSGKTFTIEGGNTQSAKGLMQRSMEMIFEQVEYLKKVGWNYQLQVYLELHRDLLTDSKISEKQEPVFEEVKSIEQFYPLLKISRDNRKVGSTMANDQSSRSHSIFQLKMIGKNTKENKESSGTLNIVDLAGSERIDHSQVKGKMLGETKFINKSLAVLGEVINALAQKGSYIPFRNSKLTLLLSPYLREGSKTLMFLNLSPASGSCQQTLCSLRFGDKVSNIKLKKN